uniref:WAP domain-containing protein n=1 Tax=Sphenodon punctatus TaxID=8508 RepID=A0A8D0LCG2_SPHPU
MEVPDGVNCTEQCRFDDECGENQKCCPAMCGASCHIPNDKPGSCPEVMSGIPVLGLCRDRCVSDSDCLDTLKCCANGCRKMDCLIPVF